MSSKTTQAGAGRLNHERGAIGAELTALAAELAPPLIVVCPANPLAGRTVLRGILCVDDVPLEQTAFRSDPTWPAATGDVRLRLAAEGVTVHAHLGIATIARGAPAISAALSESRERCAGPLIVTSDALTLFDLRAIVEGTLATETRAVLIGSGALSPVIAERMSPAVQAPTRVNATAAETSLVVFCGSRHPLSHRQVEMLVRTRGALDLITRPGAELAPLIDRMVAALDACRAVAAGTAIRLCRSGLRQRFPGGSPK